MTRDSKSVERFVFQMKEYSQKSLWEGTVFQESSLDV